MPPLTFESLMNLAETNPRLAVALLLPQGCLLHEDCREHPDLGRACLLEQLVNLRKRDMNDRAERIASATLRAHPAAPARRTAETTASSGSDE